MTQGLVGVEGRSVCNKEAHLGADHSPALFRLSGLLLVLLVSGVIFKGAFLSEVEWIITNGGMELER